MKNRSVVFRLLRLLVEERLFWAALALVTLASFFQPLRPLLYQYVIDHPLREGNLSALVGWGIALIGMAFLHALVLRGQALTTQTLAWNLIQRLRGRLFEKVLRLEIPVLERYPTGILYTRTLTDTQTLQGTLAETFLVIAGEIFQLVCLIVLMFVVDVRLATLTLLTMPLGLFTSRYFSRKIRQSFDRVRLYIGRTNGFLQEVLQSRELTASLGAEKTLWARFTRLNRLYYLSYRRVIGYFALFFPAMELVTLVGLTSVLLVGAYLLYVGKTTLGTLVAFSLYQQLFFRPFRIIADQVNSLQMGLVSAERIFRLLDRPEEERVEGKTPSEPPPYLLSFEGVSFAYTPEHPVLEGFSLACQPGRIYGLVAPTGTGKSTLFYLTLGYYRLKAGRIVLGGLNLEEWDKRALRSQIAYIPQEPVLFEGTLRENLTLYRDMPDEALWTAAKKLQLESYLRRWSLDHFIATGGSNLSAGERQLIALWRAALHEPSVWILDEPTAHIEPETEKLLYERLRVLAEKAIVLVVAHRPESQAYCDELVFLTRAHAA